MSAVSLSPLQRAWARFQRNRMGYWSLWVFVAMLLVSTGAELFSNDKPLVARIDGQLLFPILSNPSEKALGGDFVTPTDWKDPFIAELLEKPGNWAVTVFNPHSALSIDAFDKAVQPKTGWAPTARGATCWPAWCMVFGSASGSPWR